MEKDVQAGEKGGRKMEMGLDEKGEMLPFFVQTEEKIPAKNGQKSLIFAKKRTSLQNGHNFCRRRAFYPKSAAKRARFHGSVLDKGAESRGLDTC